MPSYELNKVYYFTAPLKKKYETDKANERQHAYLRVLAESEIEIIKGKFHKTDTWQRARNVNRQDFVQPVFRNLLGLNQLQISEIFKKALPDLPKAAVSRFEEKGSDVNLASYLLRDAYSQTVKQALIITADSDLATPIKFAIEADMEVDLVLPGDGMHADKLKSSASRIRKLDLSLLPNCQFPNPFMTKRGSLIYKPSSWT